MLDITRDQGRYKRGFVISRLFSVYFTITVEPQFNESPQRSFRYNERYS